MKKLLVVCSTQRSGSTMVCEDIMNVGRLGIPNEYFIKLIENSFDCWNDFKSFVIYKASTNNSCLAIKVMASHVRPVEKCFEKLTNKRLPFLGIVNEFGDPLFLRVIRRDKIRQAISRLMARRTGVYHNVTSYNSSISYGSVARIKIEENYNYGIDINDEDIRLAINEIEQEEEYWNYYFSENNIIPILIHYEDVIENLEYLNTILSSQGENGLVDLSEIIKMRNTHRLPNEKTEELYKRYIHEF